MRSSFAGQFLQRIGTGSLIWGQLGSGLVPVEKGIGIPEARLIMLRQTDSGAVFSFGMNGGDGHQHGEKFAYSKSQNGNADGGSFSHREDVCGHYVYTPDPGNLFQKLGTGRDACFFYTIKIAVDAGMHGGQRYGKGQDAQHGGSARLPEQTKCDGVCKEEEERIAKDGKGQGNAQSQPERCQSGTFPGGSLFRHQLGDGSLVSGGGQGEGQRENRA